MPRALLFAGNAMRFADGAEELERYLVHEVGVTPKRVRIYRTAYVDEGMITFRIEMAVRERTSEPLLLAYIGHGGKMGWGIDDTRRVPYPNLTALLARARRPVLVLNDCCYAMGISELFTSAHVSAKRTGVIAATEADATYCGGLVRTAIENWSRHKPVRFDNRLRWGAELDAAFYPATVAELAPEPEIMPTPVDPSLPIEPTEYVGPATLLRPNE